MAERYIVMLATGNQRCISYLMQDLSGPICDESVNVKTLSKYINRSTLPCQKAKQPCEDRLERHERKQNRCSRPTHLHRTELKRNRMAVQFLEYLHHLMAPRQQLAIYQKFTLFTLFNLNFESNSYLTQASTMMWDLFRK